MESTNAATTVATPEVLPQKEKEYVCFALMGDNFGWNFNAYTSRFGQAVFTPRKRDEDGKQIPYPKDRQQYEQFPEVRFDNGHVTVPGTDAEMLKFLREAPFCLGSELQKTQGYKPQYREVDEDRDAALRYDQTEMEVAALNLVLSLTPERLRRFALSLAGCLDENATHQRNALFDYAKRNPREAVKELGGKGSADTLVKAHILWALSNGTCTGKETALIKMGGTILGNGIDEAIAYVKANPEVGNFLAEQFKQGKKAK